MKCSRAKSNIVRPLFKERSLHFKMNALALIKISLVEVRRYSQGSGRDRFKLNNLTFVESAVVWFKVFAFQLYNNNNNNNNLYFIQPLFLMVFPLFRVVMKRIHSNCVQTSFNKPERWLSQLRSLEVATTFQVLFRWLVPFLFTVFPSFSRRFPANSMLQALGGSEVPVSLIGGLAQVGFDEVW